MTIGQTYYLQISGSDINDQCDFTLNIRNNYNCGACLLESSIDFPDVIPFNNTFSCGETVNICYTVEEFNQTASNWFHGIVPVFGEGWDFPNSFIAENMPNSCDGGGEWNLYSSVTSTNTGNIYGPGWFYDSTQGNNINLGQPLDNNPGNNWGDQNLDACTWEFCFQISTLPCDVATEGMDLSIEFENYGDSESGSWDSEGCADDPNFIFNATLVNCTPPLVVVNGGGEICGNTTTLITFEANTVSGGSNIAFQWYEDGRLMIGETNPTLTVPAYANNNIYTIVTYNECGEDSEDVTIDLLLYPQLNPNITFNSCEAFDSISIDLGVMGNNTFIWNGPTSVGDTSVATNLVNGLYNVTITNENGCSISKIFEVYPLNLVLTATDPSCDANDAYAEANVTGGVPPYTYIWNTGETTATISNLTTGTYAVTVTDAVNCEQIDTIDVIDKIGPEIITIQQLYNNSESIILNPIVLNATDYDWNFQEAVDSVILNISNSTIIEATQNGIYTLTVSNADSCFLSQEIIVNNIGLSCPFPTNRTENFNINGPNTLQLSWNGHNDAISYEIAGRKVGGNNSWNFWTTTTTYRNFSNVTSGTYEWTVRAFCENGNSEWVLPPRQFAYNTSNKIHLPNPFETENVAALSNFSIYPNPATSQVTLAYQQNQINETVEIAIFDMLGKKVLKQKQVAILGKNAIILDIEHLQKACYFVKIDNGKEQITDKLMVF